MLELAQLNLPKVSAKGPEISLSPLIDIVFLLLIFFMVSSVFPEKDGIVIEKPESEHAVNLGEKNIMIKIDSRGKVYYQATQLTLKDLSRIVKQQQQINPAVAVIIQADKLTTTQNLIKVIDAVKKIGINQLGLAVNEKSG